MDFTALTYCQGTVWLPWHKLYAEPYSGQSAATSQFDAGRCVCKSSTIPPEEGLGIEKKTQDMVLSNVQWKFAVCGCLYHRWNKDVNAFNKNRSSWAFAYCKGLWGSVPPEGGHRTGGTWFQQELRSSWPPAYCKGSWGSVIHADSSDGHIDVSTWVNWLYKCVNPCKLTVQMC